jgi:gliding motility-associated-like protein
MVKSKLLLSCAFLLALCTMTTSTSAQISMVGPDGYIKATSLEIGIRGLGGFEGVDVLSSPVPAGMHLRSANNLFGFVANPQLNAWAGSAFDGDFFTPGSPENGWGFEIGTTGSAAAGTLGGNNCSYLQQINGALTGNSTVFNCMNVDWEGDATSGTDLHFKINYFVQMSDLFYTTTVSITNNTSATIPEMYYYRNVDPDNNQEIGAGFTTTNVIDDNPPSSLCDLAHVHATQSTPWNSYLGFAAIGANWRATYGGFSNRDASNLWNGIGFVQAPGSTNVADEAISLAYKITNLAPGATETFKFVVILDAASANNAINNSLYFTYPGSATAPPSVCTPYTDTVMTCGGPVPITITGPIVGDYSWAWTPTAGLSPATGSSVVANPSVTTTYTATGTPLNTCVNPVSLTFVVMVTPSGGANPVIQAVPTICVSDPPFTFSVDSTGGIWTISPSCSGCLNSTTGAFDPGLINPGTYLITYTTSNTCNSTDTMNITVAGSDPTIASTTPVCAGSAPFTMTAASPGGVWSATCGSCINASTGSFDPTTAGSFTVTYSISGSCTAVDTQTVIVNPTVPPTTGFSYPSPVCIGGPNPTMTPVAGFTNGGTFSATPAGLSINSGTGAVNLSASSPGTYTITYFYAATGCGPAGSSSSTLVVEPLVIPTLGFSYPTSCENDTAALSPVNVAGFTSGGVYTWTNSGGGSGTLVIDSLTGVIDVVGSDPGDYTITYTVQGSVSPCAAPGSNSTSYTINPLPTILMGNATTIWVGDGTWLYATTTGTTGATYSWSPTQYLTCPTCDSTVASPPETQEYCVTVTELGCVDSACVTLNIEIPCPNNRNMGVPNAFSPNGDGINDQFCLDGWGDCISKFEVVIFDRWGEKVFESPDPGFCWNGIYKGKQLDPAVFVYFIRATYESAGATPDSPRGSFEANRTGNISLVR